MHSWGFVNSQWDPSGAPLGFCEFAVGPQWCTHGVLEIRSGTPAVHPWGFVNSQWDPSGAPLGFCEFAVGPQWCTLGVFKFAVVPQWCTLGVLRIRSGTPVVHPWGFGNSQWDPSGAPLGFCEFAVGPQ